MKQGGDVKFVDMETHQPLVTRISEKQRVEYKRRIEEHLLMIRATCNAVGCDFFSFTTDMPIFDAFSELNTKATIWRA
jgi:hypothetical protein